MTSVELLTRRDEESDFATDVCVRREGADPETGNRYVEEISFEVANTQTLKCQDMAILERWFDKPLHGTP